MDILEFSIYGVPVGTVLSGVIWFLLNRRKIRKLIKEAKKETTTYWMSLYKKLSKSAKKMRAVMVVEIKELFEIAMKYPNPMRAVNGLINAMEDLFEKYQLELKSKLSAMQKPEGVKGNGKN